MADNDEFDFTPDPAAEPATGAEPASDPTPEPAGSSEGGAAPEPKPSTPTPASFVDRLRAAKIDVESEDQALTEYVLLRDRYAQAEQEREQLRQWRQQMEQQLGPHWQDIQQVIAKKSQPKEPSADPLAAWKQPPLPKGWEQWYSKDENGKWVRDPSTPLEIVQAVNAHAQWKEQHEQRLADLPGALKQAGYLTQADVDARMQQLREELLQQVNGEFTGRELHQSIAQTLDSMRPKFVGKDGKHTPYYHAFQARVKQAEGMGMSPQQQMQYATELAEADLLREEKQLREKQEASRVKAGLPPAVTGGSARVAPIQKDPSIPARETIEDSMKAHWGEVEKMFASQ